VRPLAKWLVVLGIVIVLVLGVVVFFFAWPGISPQSDTQIAGRRATEDNVGEAAQPRSDVATLDVGRPLDSGGNTEPPARETSQPNSPTPATDENADVDSKPNRLISEKSPYLLQHAYNPTDWYPWGPEAFEKARLENKPIFLSIGYSTCHWCHVMENESFEDFEVARLLNDTFVAIKVDREERPDIDNYFMNAAMMMTGSGGWPLNVMLTPDLKPFFATTYIPKESRFGRLGMLELIPLVQEAWLNQDEELLDVADQVAGALEESLEVSPAGELTLDETLLDTAYRQLAGRFDPQHGGFGEAPKFPSPHTLLFLLRYWERTGDEAAAWR
jgi:uncharacterized protein YyaL (SSP411 family)